MTVYWLLFIFPVLASISPIKTDRIFSIIIWSTYFSILVLAIGFRYEVGGDWENYLTHNTSYTNLKYINFLDLFQIYYFVKDIGFIVIHWISENFFNGIYTTNLICAFIFSAGLYKICRNENFSWISVSISIPYLVVVVAMGYTRQAAAVGFVMLALSEGMCNNKRKFFLHMLLAILLHKTAVIMLVLGLFIKNNTKYFKVFEIAIFIFVSILLLLSLDNIKDMLFHYYEDKTMQSSGAFVRISLSFLSSIVFFINMKKWKLYYSDYKLWLSFSVLTLFMLPASLEFSTLIDRLGIYFIPMQLVIFSRVMNFIDNSVHRALYGISILILYSIVLFVWLNYAVHSVYWIPYNNILFL